MNYAFSANSTCAEAHVPAEHRSLQSRLQTRTVERVVSLITAMRKHHRTPVAARTASPFCPPTLKPGRCCSLVTGCVLIPGVGAGSLRLSVAYVCPLLAHTYQAIVVLLPKLTNAPTKVHTGCVVFCGSGHFCFLCIIHIHYCWLFFCIVLIIMPLLQLSHHYIHIVTIPHISFFGGFVPN